MLLPPGSQEEEKNSARPKHHVLESWVRMETLLRTLSGEFRLGAELMVPSSRQRRKRKVLESEEGHILQVPEEAALFSQEGTEKTRA